MPFFCAGSKSLGLRLLFLEGNQQWVMVHHSQFILKPLFGFWSFSFGILRIDLLERSPEVWYGADRRYIE